MTIAGASFSTNKRNGTANGSAAATLRRDWHETKTANSKRPTANCELRRSVRELRQRRTYYRCCIPALAGFVSHRSIAPDGFVNIRMDRSSEQRLFSYRSWNRGSSITLLSNCLQKMRYLIKTP